MPDSDEPRPLNDEGGQHFAAEASNLEKANASEETWIRSVIRHTPITSILVVALLLIANTAIRLPFYVLSPGQATPVSRFVRVQPDKAFPPEGDVLFTTVSLRQAHPFDLLWAAILPSEELEDQRAVSGDFTPQEFTDLNSEAMDSSKLTAISVSMTRAGYEISTTGDGALVQEVAEGAPVTGSIEAGEVITAIGGNPVRLSSDLTSAIASVVPGTAIQLEVRANDKTMRTVDLTVAARPNDPNKGFLGVVVSTANIRLNTPFPVSIDTNDIGGPSAGLAFTLALLDQLTPGSLTGGQVVATTGTMEPDGRVGPVGGVVQKAAAVNGTDATVFLVPSDEFEDAKAAADDDVEVVSVDTLEQALDALAANGGDVSGVDAAVATAAD